MKFNKILVTLISLLFLLLVACNNTNDNEDASKNDPSEEDAISFTKTDQSSGDLQTDQIENQQNQGNFNVNMFGLGEDDKNWNQREQSRQGLDRQDLGQFRQDQQNQDQQGQQGNQGQRDQQQQNQGQQGQMQQQQDQQTQDEANQTQPQQGQNEYTSAVIKLTNQERSNQGLSPLKAHKKLSNVARNKAVDMQSNGYFSHTSPTHGSPFDMMKDAGVSYQSAGENIARGQKSPQQVVDAWMNSQGHRENILNGNFTHIGVGYTESGNYWSQMFIQK